MEQFYSDYSLKQHNSFGFDAKAQYFYCFEQDNEILHFCRHELNRYPEIKILGAGNNVLLTSDINGLVIHPVNQQIEIVDKTETKITIRVGAGVDWDHLVDYTLKNNWYGLENLSLIPGSAGAAPVQNIGAYGVEVEQFIDKVKAINLKTAQIYDLNRDECRFGYRYSVFKEKENANLLILSVDLTLHLQPNVNLSYQALFDAIGRNPDASPHLIRQKVVEIRRSKLPDPKITGNAGSFFKNPLLGNDEAQLIIEKHPNIPHWKTEDGKIKFAAGWLIEQCGFKGHTTPQGAGVCPTQALVLVNSGASDGRNVLDLANKIIATVKEKFGITLEPEVNIW